MNLLQFPSSPPQETLQISVTLLPEEFVMNLSNAMHIMQWQDQDQGNIINQSDDVCLQGCITKTSEKPSVPRMSHQADGFLPGSENENLLQVSVLTQRVYSIAEQAVVRQSCNAQSFQFTHSYVLHLIQGQLKTSCQQQQGILRLMKVLIIQVII